MPLLQNIFFTISYRNVIDEHKKIYNFVIVIYMDSLKLDDDVLNIPLFMADQADRLIGLALEHKHG